MNIRLIVTIQKDVRPIRNDQLGEGIKDDFAWWRNFLGKKRKRKSFGQYSYFVNIAT